jgi:hypothetical protein
MEAAFMQNSSPARMPAGRTAGRIERRGVKQRLTAWVKRAALHYVPSPYQVLLAISEICEELGKIFQNPTRRRKNSSVGSGTLCVGHL